MKIKFGAGGVAAPGEKKSKVAGWGTRPRPEKREDKYEWI